MPDIQITVADVIQPGFDSKTGQQKKQGKIIDTTGKSWQVWADKLGLYEAGGNYTITQHKNNVFNGITFNVIEKMTPGGLPAVGTVRTISTSAPKQTRVPMQQQGLTPKDEMIFVCGGFNNIMANPNTPAATMSLPERIAIVESLRATWRNTFGKTQASDDMNDALPL